MKLSALVTQTLLMTALTGAADQTISIDAAASTVRRPGVATFSVGSDRAKIFLRPEHQRDLRTLQKEIGFRYLRCHGLFNEEMKVVSRDAEGKLHFDWTNVDLFIGQLRDAKIKPFFELGFMPEPIASGRQTIFWWQGNVTPPAQMAEWSQLVTEFAKHLLAKYGRREVHNWYFEVWNEPNLDGFWTGGKAKYLELYATSAHALKGVDPKLRVGGPSTAGLAWIPDLVAYCREHSVPLDFISSHAYAAMQGFLDADGRGGGTVLDTSPGALTDGFRQSRHDTPAGMPLFISEWGPSYSPRDPIHDSYVCAPFVLQKVREAEHLVDGLSYWTFTDQFEEPGPPHTPFHGGFGLMTVDGLRKPGFFAYSILSQLYPNEIETDARQVIATKQGSDLRIVLWDYSPYKQDAPNDPFYHRDLKPTDLGSTRVEIRNLPDGRYRVTRFGVGYRRNDVYDAFRTLQADTSTFEPGKGAHRAPSVIKALNAQYTKPERLNDIEVRHGHATLELPMRTNDVWYLDIAKIDHSNW